MIRIDNPRDHIYRVDADNLAEFLDYLDTAPTKWRHFPCHSQDVKDNATEWTGTATFAEAQRLARQGWPEGLEYLTRVNATLGRATRGIARNAQSLDRGGAFPVVPLAIAGDPMHMVSIGEEQRATRPFVRFWINIAASGGVGRATIAARGAAILAWIDALENAGARCELWIAEGGKYDAEKQRVEIAVRIKGFDEALEMDRCAYLLLNAGVQRRQFFRFYETLPLRVEGYGAPLDVPPPKDGVATVEFSSLNYSDWSDPAQASETVKRLIAEQCADLGATLEAA